MNDSQSIQKAKIFFFSGLEKLNKNNFIGAEIDFEFSLSLAPNRLSTLINLSIVLIKLNKYENAEKLILMGLLHHPKNKELILNLVEIYKILIYHKPDYAEAHSNLGNSYKELKMYEEALASYSDALRLNPNLAEVYSNRGIVFNELKKYQEALQDYDKAIAMKANLASAYSNRGITLNKLNRLDEALSSYTRAIEINPYEYEAYSNRGITLNKIKRFNEALSNYNRAIEINSGFVEAYSNRGNTLKELNRLDDALASYERAIQINPLFAEAYSNRGVALQELKLYEEALNNFEKAIISDPSYPNGYFNKSILLLIMKNFNEGLKLYYDWRWKSTQFDSEKLKTSIPRWDQKISNAGIKILLWAEQGIGDEIFYFGMLKNFAEIDARITISADPRLHSLFKRSIPEIELINSKTVVAVNIENLFDYQAPIGDIGFLCNVDKALENKTAKNFLQINQSRCSEIKNKNHFLSDKFVCGISWKSTNKDIGITKSLNLNDLSPILSIENVVFVSLQYGSTADEIEFVEKNIGIKIHTIDSLDIFNDIDGLVSLISICDFVITTSNITAHLTGAIGKKGMVLMPFSKGKIWYWHSGVGPSLWYPSLELVSQSQMNDWTEPINKCKEWVLKQL